MRVKWSYDGENFMYGEATNLDVEFAGRKWVRVQPDLRVDKNGREYEPNPLLLSKKIVEADDE